GKELEEFMLAHYAEGNIPQKIYVQEEFGGRKALEGYLGGIAGSRVAITVPQKGDKKKLLELLAKNMESEIPVALVKLRRALSLREIPRVIECFDVSNLGKEGIVGAMVRFVDGKPDKGNYRKFKIKEVKGQDDFASMKEIVFRRYLRLGRENAEMPNLVLVDGGVGQLNSAMKALSELGVDLECISLAKEEEKVYSPKFSQPIALPKTDEGLKILMHARDEAHRFAISYQRKVRGRSSGIA
ncbi:excinuclease ABC subunit C, partial [Candidatus Micrarchaeota archaeon CG11_big_fil_rev_8_21_14_0_20_47_5]